MARKLESEAELRRRGVIDPRSDAFAAHEARPLTEYLDAFKSALIARGGTGRHAHVTRYRAQRGLELSGIRRISEISLSKVLDVIQKLQDEDLRIETANHHVREVKGFARWLWRDGRTREVYLAHLAT